MGTKKLSDNEIRYQKQVILQKVEYLEMVALDYPEKTTIITPYIALCPVNICHECFLDTSIDCFCHRNSYFHNILFEITHCLYKEEQRLRVVGLLQILKERLEEAYGDYRTE